MMADLLADRLVFAGSADARSRSMSARVSPAPNAPICKKFRRVSPSQNRCRAPMSVNMRFPPKTKFPELHERHRYRNPPVPAVQSNFDKLLRFVGRGDGDDLALRDAGAGADAESEMAGAEDAGFPQDHAVAVVVHGHGLAFLAFDALHAGGQLQGQTLAEGRILHVGGHGE